MDGSGPPEKAESFRAELLKNPNILETGMNDYMPHSSSNWTYVTWEGAGPEEYMKMNVNYVDEDYQQLYVEEKKAGRVILYLAILAILIACMGILGLSSYTSQQRTKEVGIRRVVGASMTNITLLLTKDFLKLVLLANILAWPVGYLAMLEWLKNFPYRTEISWLVFVLAGLATVLIAFGMVVYQAVRAARANPVDSLRYE